jgi:Zn finger protein HypA/HybF involved in hydrogenase expression
MTFHCHFCSWSGDSDDRVPASADWVAQHNVDFEHFTQNSLNCPDCGEAQFTMSGDDDFDPGHPDDCSADDGGADYVLCPSCDSYTEASELASTGGEGFSVCPQCGYVGADDEFVAGE